MRAIKSLALTHKLSLLLFLITYLGAPVIALVPSLSTALIAQTNVSAPDPPQAQASNTASFRRVHYLVPNTSTFIDALFFVTLELNRGDVAIVLSAIEQQLTDHINEHGDGPLSDTDDPYEFGVPRCHSSTGSEKRDSLSYGRLRDVMTGLQHLMVDQSMSYVAYYEIKDGSAAGRELGDGVLERHDGSPDLISTA